LLERNSIDVRDALGPILEWIELRLKADRWIQKQLALVTDAEARRFESLLCDAVLAYWKRSDGTQKRQLVPHVHQQHKEKARKAIQKLVAALEALNCDPDITDLLEHERHEWARRLLRHEVDETPREAALLAKLLESERPDHNAIEELRGLWHARKHAPKVLDLLQTLEAKVALLRASPVTKFSARSMFLREIWSGLVAHTLEKKRITFVAHVDDAVFPGHWTGERETHIHELNLVVSDLRREERALKKIFPELYRRLGS